MHVMVDSGFVVAVWPVVLNWVTLLLKGNYILASCTKPLTRRDFVFFAQGLLYKGKTWWQYSLKDVCLIRFIALYLTACIFHLQSVVTPCSLFWLAQCVPKSNMYEEILWLNPKIPRCFICCIARLDMLQSPLDHSLTASFAVKR